jgi:TonB family protein
VGRRAGIDLAHSWCVLHLYPSGPDTPHLPNRRFVATRQYAVSAIVHGVGVLALVLLAGTPRVPPGDRSRSIEDPPCLDLTRVVFVATDPRPGAGGGGGGGRSDGPIRRAQHPGSDAVTLRTRKPPAAVAMAATLPEPALPSIVIDAVPLSAGTVDQLGLPSMTAPSAGSTGSGTGGGVGTGTGSGIGSGQGPGLGAGAGGGAGGGLYHPGGAVTAPRVIVEVKPKYTNDALLRRTQGTVQLELVVTRDGRPTRIRVVRSLDPGGLDDEAVAAVQQWRFDPGRIAGIPVDVLVIVLLDFTIR